MGTNIFQCDTVRLNNRDMCKYSMPNEQIHITHIFDGHDSDAFSNRHESHIHDFYMLVWVDIGNFNCVVNTDNYNIGNKTLLFIPLGEAHSYHSNFNIEGVSIFFTENFFRALPESWVHFLKFGILHNLSSLELIDEESISNFKASLNALQCELTLFSKHHNNFIGVYSALALLLYGISGTNEFKYIAPKVKNAHNKSQALYFSFLEKLEAQYATYHSVEHYAVELNTSIANLEACCKECSGEKPTTIIRNRIIQEAKRMLIYTIKRSGEIADSLGFLEHSHFVNYFKKHVKATPSEFRKQHGVVLC